MTDNPFFDRPEAFAVDFETKVEREINKLIEHHLVDANKMVTAGARS